MTDLPPAPPRFRDSLRAGFVVTAGIGAPRGTALSRALAEAAALRGRVDAVTVADAPGPEAAMSPSAAARAVREGAGLDTVCLFDPGRRGLAALQSELLGISALGVGNVAVLPGSRQGGGDGVPGPESFLRLASGLNAGVGADGRELEGATDLLIGTFSNPAAPRLGEEIRRLRSDMEAGARFTVTAPVFRARDAEPFLAEAGSLGIPVLVGVLPVGSREALRRLADGLPGAAVPAEALRRLERTPPGKIGEEGVLMLRELAADLHDTAAGLHVMPSGDAALTGRVLDGILAERRGGEAAAEPAERVERAVQEAAAEGRIPCRRAFRVARETDVAPAEVGRVIQRLGVKITACQLGCFR